MTPLILTPRWALLFYEAISLIFNYNFKCIQQRILLRIIQKFIILLSMNTITDKKRTNGTIDRTSPFTGAGLEFNNTFQRKSSDSRSTASNLSISNSFEISAQTLMPILLKIKDENQRFGGEKDQICQQMKTLQNLTQTLLTENQALRFHYKQRSNDVKQLIQSMTVNFNEDLNQTKHLVHSYREHNCMLAKQIQQINSKMTQHQQIINKVAQQLHRTTFSNSKFENNLRSRQVKNKLTSKTMNKLEKIRDSKKIEQLEKDICDLQLDINLMKKKNIFTVNYIRGERSAITAQKPQIKDRAIQAIKSGKKLKQEVEVIEADYKKYCHEKEELQLKTENLNKKYQTLYTNAQSKRNKLKRLTEKKAQLQESCVKLKCTNEILNKEKEKKEEEKLKIEKQIKKKKQQICNSTVDHQKKKNNITNQAHKKIGNSKEQVRKLEGNMNKTIFKELNPQKIQFQNILLSLKKELQYLNNQSNDLNQKVNSMQNPLKDILRMEMQLKKIKSSKR